MLPRECRRRETTSRINRFRFTRRTSCPFSLVKLTDLFICRFVEELGMQDMPLEFRGRTI